MHVLIDILSPHPFYSSLTYPINSLCLNTESIERVRLVNKLYESPVVSLPIHRGKLYNFGALVIKPKLLKSIGSVHLKVNMMPLVLGLLNEMEDDSTSGVGVRCRAERMDIDVRFVQRLVKKKKVDVGEISQIKRTLTKWHLAESEIGFSELEGRTISFGNLGHLLDEDDVSARKKTTKAPDPINEDNEENEADDRKEWILDEDCQYLEDTSKMRMVPFIWSPKITYFKRTDADEFSIEDKMKSEGCMFL